VSTAKETPNPTQESMRIVTRVFRPGMVAFSDMREITYNEGEAEYSHVDIAIVR
jgi:hypothetical protein